MLSSVLDVFRMRQYFNVLLRARGVATGLREDAAFLDAVRRTVLPLPFDRVAPRDLRPFPEPEPLHLPALRGGRVGIVASGGSGALASVVGVWRALEEASITPSVVAVCSGSALFGFPLAAGLDAETVAAFVLDMRADDYIDVNWRDLAGGALRAGRGFAGIIRGERLEHAYARLVGDMTLGELPVPCYAPLWNIEENRVEYAGPATHPTLSVARAIRAAISIPLFLDPVRIAGGSWGDGGIVDIFPVHPLLEHEDTPDVAVGINGFYPDDFAGEGVHGWRDRPFSILTAASQIRTSQHVELARVNLARLRRHCDVELISPVPYAAVRGVGFYQQFIDRREWPDFMRAGRARARDALRRLDERAGAPRGRRTAAKRRSARPGAGGRRAGASSRG